MFRRCFGCVLMVFCRCSEGDLGCFGGVLFLGGRGGGVGVGGVGEDGWVGGGWLGGGGDLENENLFSCQIQKF